MEDGASDLVSYTMRSHWGCARGKNHPRKTSDPAGVAQIATRPCGQRDQHSSVHFIPFEASREWGGGGWGLGGNLPLMIGNEQRQEEWDLCPKSILSDECSLMDIKTRWINGSLVDQAAEPKAPSFNSKAVERCAGIKEQFRLNYPLRQEWEEQGKEMAGPRGGEGGVIHSHCRL